MHGILSYEEMVRVQRDNGLRPKDECTPCHNGCSVQGEGQFKGMTYADVAKTPQPLRRTCPHTKVIVPVTPVLMVNEPVKQHTPKMGEAKWRVADFNHCDARNQGLYAIPNDAKAEYAETQVKATTRVIDNPFDYPHEVTTIVSDVAKVDGVAQPAATDATEADPVLMTDDGLTAKPADSFDTAPKTVAEPVEPTEDTDTE